jgi:hypothetical protein
MIRISFTEPTSSAWADWKAEGAEKTKVMIAAWKRGEKPKIDEKFYRRRRDDFVAIFNGKCAYCEQLITTSQRGDIEHFRPKAGVTDKEGKPVKVRGKKGMQDHPGYFWLAYEPGNLLLACIRCNQGNKGKDGTGYGKLNYFPVEGEYASAPGEEKKEKALFVHPVQEDPEPWFVFDEATGILGAVDNNPRAVWCIERLGLNRELLPERRRDVFVSFSSLLEKISNATMMNSQDVLRVSGTVDQLLAAKRGRGEFTFVFRRTLALYVDRARKCVDMLAHLRN